MVEREEVVRSLPVLQLAEPQDAVMSSAPMHETTILLTKEVDEVPLAPIPSITAIEQVADLEQPESNVDFDKALEDMMDQDDTQET